VQNGPVNIVDPKGLDLTIRDLPSPSWRRLVARQAEEEEENRRRQEEEDRAWRNDAANNPEWDGGDPDWIG
jgi:hypothetical protein